MKLKSRNPKAYKSEKKKSFYTVYYGDKEYKIVAKNRNEATSKVAYILDVPIRALYGKIKVIKDERGYNKYVVINRNKEIVMSGSVEEN